MQASERARVHARYTCGRARGETSRCVCVLAGYGVRATHVTPQEEVGSRCSMDLVAGRGQVFEFAATLVAVHVVFGADDTSADTPEHSEEVELAVAAHV